MFVVSYQETVRDDYILTQQKDKIKSVGVVCYRNACRSQYNAQNLVILIASSILAVSAFCFPWINMDKVYESNYYYKDISLFGQ